VSAPPNSAPTVTATNVTLSRNQAVAATSLFSFADADGDSLMFKVNNVTGNTAAGFWAVDGERLMGEFIISQANLHRLSYQVGSAGTNTLSITATDGVASSAAATFQVSAPSNSAPTVSASNVTLSRNQAVAATSLFSFADADGDSPTRYQFVDGTLGGGRFSVGGVAQAEDQIIDVLAGQLAATQFQASNASGGSDALFARAFDGVAWSAWKSWNIVAQG